MSFDPMAAAIDWLEAYRARDLETLLGMYSDDATVECGCGGMKTISGSDALRAYWLQRLKDYPASELDDLQPSKDGASIVYTSSAGAVGASLEFNSAGRIAYLRCGPLVLL